MKCHKCQFENPDNIRFCGNCGTELDPTERDTVLKTKTQQMPIEEITRGTIFAERYEIVEELGKGGMGKVYRAEDIKIKEEVALKLIKPEIVSDKKTIERFSNELKYARKIAHRNVCKMYDLGETEGTHYITMEYVSGEDLQSLVWRIGQFSIRKAVITAKQICDGLSEAHSLGVTHRDLKPQNIMIDRDGNVRIMDFGIARSIESKGLTKTGVIMGTPEYMSPEQIDGIEVDNRSDIYSLGCILYKMLTGNVPFEGDTPLTIGIKHKTENPRDPRESNPLIPKDLSNLILKCMEKNREKRYQSTVDILYDLEAIERGVPTTDRIIPKRKSIVLKLKLKKLFISVLVILAIAIIAVTVRHFIPSLPFSIEEDNFTAGKKYWESKNYSEALNQFKKVLAKDPENFEAQIIIANILKEQGKIDDAIPEYEKAIAINDKNSQSYKQLGEISEQKQEFEKAVQYYRKYLNIAPNSSDANIINQKISKLETQLQSEKKMARIEEERKALKQEKEVTQKPPKAKLNKMDQARNYVKSGRYSNAISLLETEVNENPKNAEAHFLLGKSYLHTNEEDKANISFNRTITAEPNFRVEVANEYMKSGKKLLEEAELKQAKGRFDQAVNFESNMRRDVAEIMIKRGEELSKTDINGSLWCFREAIQYSESQKNYVGALCLKITPNLLKNKKHKEAQSFIDFAKELEVLKPELPTEEIKIKKKVDADYPESMVEAGIEGNVKLEVITDIHGRVIYAKVLESLHPVLDQAAIEAVIQWTIEPVIKYGKPIQAKFRVNILFEVDNNLKKN